MKSVRVVAFAFVLAFFGACTSKSGGKPELHLYTALDTDEAPLYIKAAEQKLGSPQYPHRLIKFPSCCSLPV